MNIHAEQIVTGRRQARRAMEEMQAKYATEEAARDMLRLHGPTKALREWIQAFRTEKALRNG